MEEKKYLKWYNKVGYGSGDLAANFIYSLVSSFVLLYLTDTVGLNSGIIGTLMMLSKFFDGVTDVFFGTMIDKTHSKMGKARPWMLFSEIGCCIILVAIFSIPTMGATAQYAYFFVTYTLLNAVFYTANNIAYSSLTSLITKNGNERVQMGSIRFMFALVASVIVSSITVNLVAAMGGGAAGWRNVALIYALVALIVNSISVFSVKELSGEELSEGIEAEDNSKEEKITLVNSIKLLASNKYFLLILVFYILMYVQTGVSSGIGVYYMTHVLGNASLLGTFSMVSSVPIIIGLAFTPLLVKRFGGMYKVNLYGYSLAVVFRILFVIFGYMRNVPLMLASVAIAGLCSSPVVGDINALVSATSEYTVRTKGIHIEGAMFSCSSLGIKVGSGIGSALSGWLLAACGYVAGAEVQPASCINMLDFMYLWIPLIITAVIALVIYLLKVEKANRDWDAAHGVEE